MTSTAQALSKRIKELRRRHFGAGGAGEFARRLGVPPEDYERYERSSVPPGEIMVRMCELTGEDLQWLLTGVAARGTVVIAGTRSRHQALLTKVAKLLDERPTCAAALESFVDLLVGGERARGADDRDLPAPAPRELIPIYDGHELPLRLPESGDEAADQVFPLTLPGPDTTVTARETAGLVEPAGDYEDAVFRQVEMLTIQAAHGQTRRCVHSAEIAGCFPGMFGVRLRDDAMSPMCNAGDAVLVSVGARPKVGHPVLCRLADEAAICCGIWLGEDAQSVHLGRLANGDIESLARANVCWALEVLYRLAPAA